MKPNHRTLTAGERLEARARTYGALSRRFPCLRESELIIRLISGQLVYCTTEPAGSRRQRWRVDLEAGTVNETR